jgi:hypothetical protein
MRHPDTHMARLAGGDTTELTPGADYIITYRFHGEGYDREARLGYLGTGHGGELWNAEPLAGTQTIPASVIKTVATTEVQPRKRYINRRAVTR